MENAHAEQPRPIPQARRRERVPVRKEVNDYYGDENDMERDDRMSNVGARRFRRGMGGRGDRYGNRGERNRERVDNNLGSIKVKIPTFQGEIDPEAYLEWEKRIELVFDCHDYSD